jgi:transposase
MSLKENWNIEIPADTAEVGGAILKADSPYRLIGERINALLHMTDFEDLYSKIGRGAICPIILALVTVFQYLERIPDRVAAEWVVTRLDWKYALHLGLKAQGFHFSDLSNFRQRLLEHEAERLIFDKVLQWVRVCGMLRKYGRQRTDSTHVLGAVECLTRLEMVWETLRTTIAALEKQVPTWYTPVIPAAFAETYGKRRSEWKVSEEETAKELQQAGRDGFWLLAQLDQGAPEVALALPEVQTLRQVWQQEFTWDEKREEIGPPPPKRRGDGKERIVTPHDPEVRWSKKRDTEWRGYKLQVTETAEEENPVQFITDIDITGACDHDSEALPEIHQRLDERDLCPQEHYVDQGYPSGPNLAQSHARHIELIGPVSSDTNKKPAGYQQTDFDVDMSQHRAVCPHGKVADRWYPRPTPDGYAGAEIYFGKQCEGCPARELCAPGKQGRTLNINPYHELLAARRAEQKTEAFKQQMHRRAAVEGTVSELTRAHGARRARYRGLAKVRLQALFTGAAANVKRLARALAEQQTHKKSEMAYA